MKRNVREKFSKYDSCNLKNTNGITLIALIVTIIVLLILAGVSLSGVFSERGIFNRAESAGEKYNEAKAREVLETVLMTDGQMEKHTNPKYNQDDFLDKLIKSEIEGSDVKGDIAIVGGYAYELDRSVPKIGRYLGKAEDLVFPTVTATDPVIANDYRSASFTVTALEEKNGVNKIEIWLNGEKVETLTKTYNNIKTEITENFTVNRNGVYTIKAYGDLMASVTVEVTGIVPMVEFSPNGSAEWKKEHTTKIIVKETEERVTNIKYKWTTSSTNPPAETEFTENCPSNNVVTGGNDTMTGEYFLWVLLTTESGKTNICGSEGFKFDNEGPTITSFTSTANSENSLTLNITIQDSKSGLNKVEFYIDSSLQYTQPCSAETTNITKNYFKDELTTGYHDMEVRVYDSLGNMTSSTLRDKTKQYAWQKYSADCNNKYLNKVVSTTKETISNSTWPAPVRFENCYEGYTFDGATGKFKGTGDSTTQTAFNVHQHYIIHSGYMLYYIRTANNVSANTVDYTIIRREAVLNSNPTYTKGSTNYGVVVNNKEDAYPTNGYQSGYFYVKTTSR